MPNINITEDDLEGWNIFKKYKNRREDVLPLGLLTPVFLVPKLKLEEIESFFQLWKYSGSYVGSLSLEDWRNFDLGHGFITISNVYEVGYNGRLVYRQLSKEIHLLRRL